LASGDSTAPVGIDFGSETMFMPHFTREAGAVQPPEQPDYGTR
jgi:hypothetical protein